MVTKRINLENIRFSTSTKVVIPELITKGNALKAAPNPLETISEIYFNTKQIAMVRLVIYNQLGRVVKEIPYTTIVGENKIILKKGRLSTGLYFCKIIGASEDHKVVKLIIN
nr:T9SS type A sorting domain-containing protein [Tenacibaculum finnmarkense]